MYGFAVLWGVILLEFFIRIRPGIGVYARSACVILFIMACMSLYLKGGALAFFYHDLVYVAGGRDRFFNGNYTEKWAIGMTMGTIMLTALVVGFCVADRLGLCPQIKTTGVREVPFEGREGQVEMMLIVLLLLSMCAFIGLVASIGTTSLLESLSTKRDISGSPMIYVMMKVVYVSRIGALISILLIFLRSKVRFLVPFAILFGVILFASSVLLSNRSYLFGFFFEIYILAKFSGLKIRPMHILGAFLGLGSLMWISISRMGAKLEGLVDNVELFILGRLVEGRYLFDVTKIGEIGHWFEENEFGEFAPFLTWLVAPFMSVFSYKQMGPYISDKVYGESTNGVTPGFYVELIISFGLLGSIVAIFIFALIFAALSKVVMSTVPPEFRLLLLAMILAKLVLIFNSSLGAGAFSAFIDCAYLFVVAVMLGCAKFLEVWFDHAKNRQIHS